MQKINNSSLLRSTSLEKGKIKKAFTLVELIVVITILAILGTIAFISLQGYSRDARDSTRLADINSINTQLELFVIKTGTLPIPEDNIELISSGVTIGYQGYVGQNTLNILKVNNGGLDPVDQSPYVYRISGNKKSYQIMGFLENGNQLSYQVPSPERGGLGRGILQANAAINLTNRFPFSKGKVLGILLEPTTNIPLQELLGIGQVGIRIDTTNVDMYLSNTVKQNGKINTLYGTMENLSRSQKFDKPQKDCPKGYIPVPGNIDFGQPAFCVAKYEMSYAGSYGDVPNTIGINFNTISYTGGKIPVSLQSRYPIAEITQPQAISACKSIGSGYHLITNNEWMTIARNIEKQAINWSGGIIGQNYIYSGVSNSSMGCGINSTKTIYPSLLRNWVAKTGAGTGNTTCNNKRKLQLSNQEEIWDLVGNVRENVNKANTIDGIGYNSGQTIILGSSSGTTLDDDGIYSKVDMNKYGSIFTYGMDKGMGILYYADGINKNAFLRGGSTNWSLSSGLFTILIDWDDSLNNGHIGFRCAK